MEFRQGDLVAWTRIIGRLVCPLAFTATGYCGLICDCSVVAATSAVGKLIFHEGLDMSRRTLRWFLLVAMVAIFGLASESAFAQRRIRIGGPFGVAVGGGQGLTIGGGYGVQLGGGQGLRFGPPRAGVQYGGGQGVRFGTTNFGVQYGGGQLLRYGAPNAGVRIGGGEGVRLGTSQGGVRFGNGTGLQVGRFREGQVVPMNAVPAAQGQSLQAQPVLGQPIQSLPAQAQPVSPNVLENNQRGGRPVFDAIRDAIQGQSAQGQPVPQNAVPQSGFTAPTMTPSRGVVDPQVDSAGNPAVNAPMPKVTNPVAGQTQFDAARQAVGQSVAPATQKTLLDAPKVKVPPVPDGSSTGKSILERK